LSEQKATAVKTQVQAGIAIAQEKAQQVSQGVAQKVTYGQERANEIFTSTQEEVANATAFMKTKVGSWENTLDDAFGYYTQWTRSKLDVGNGEMRAGTVQAADPNKRVGP
jgi:DNA anti-recombination protein RmuC